MGYDLGDAHLSRHGNGVSRVAALRRAAKSLGIGVLKTSPVRRLAIQTARARRRNLILVYHRMGETDDGPEQIVPALPEAVFRAQIAALRGLGEVVPLRDLLEREPDEPAVRFAVTFDDDDRGHRRVALPLLRSLGVAATFFLSGRALHGLGPYWWEHLEAAIQHHGLGRVGRLLELPANSPAELAAAYETAPAPQRLRDIEVPKGEAPGLGAGDILSLAEAGMEIGFHTLHHPLLVDLPSEQIDRALTTGREALARAAGRPVELFAYPHGRANRQVAARVRNAGYLAAFTGSGRAIGPRSDRYLLGRWEPGALAGDAFLASLALRLNLPDGAQPG